MSTIKISFINKHKTFNVSDEVNLNGDLIILTGLNGSGKTHLLTSLVTHDKTRLSIGEAGVYQNQIVYKNFLNNTPYIGTPSVSRESVVQAAVSLYQSNRNISEYGNENSFSKKVKLHLLAHYGNDKYYGNPELTFKEIEDALPSDLLILDNNPFATNIVNIFQTYVNLQDENYIKRGKGKPSLNDDGFTLKYGEKPWKTINSLFTKMNVDYRFDDVYENVQQSVGSVKIYHKDNTADFRELEELSDGEKSIISLCFASFRSSYEEYFNIKCLCLDEFDATLNPSLTSALFYVLDEYFIKKNIKVILSTHSPITVALAPDWASIYEIKKVGNNPRIIEIKKAEAVKFLCSGFSYLNVDFENKIDIITEDKDDAFYYKTVYSTLLENPSDIEMPTLNFIAASDFSFLDRENELREQGGSDKVSRTINELNNPKIKGILDWDNSRSSENNISIHGHEKRYSLENYIFEPFFLMQALIKCSVLHPEDLNTTPAIIKSILHPSDFQTICDSFFEWWKNFLQSKDIDISNFSNDKITCYYVGPEKNTLSLPSWFLNTKGHDLYDNYIKILFPNLNTVSQKLLGAGVQNNSIDQVLAKAYIRENINFISLDTLEFLQSL